MQISQREVKSMNSLAAIDLEVALLSVAQRKLIGHMERFVHFPFMVSTLSYLTGFYSFPVSKPGLLLRTAAVIMRAYY